MTCCPEPNCLGSQHSCNIDAFKHTPSHFLKLVRYSKGKKNDEITAWFWNRSMLHVDCYFLRDIACFDVHSTCLNTFFCFFLQTIIFPMKGSSWSSLFCSVLTVSSGVMWLILAPTSDFLGRQNFCSVFFLNLDEHWLGIGYFWHVKDAWASSVHDVEPFSSSCAWKVVGIHY